MISVTTQMDTDQNKDFEKLLDESVQDGREQKVNDITVCRSCHGQRYYRIIWALVLR